MQHLFLASLSSYEKRFEMKMFLFIFQVKVKDVELIVKSAENALSILRHSGDHWSLEITNVWMKCPTGYNLRVTNSSAYGVTNIGLR